MADPRPRRLRPLWTCPKCGERFVTKNLYHSCGRHSYDAIFAKSQPHVRAVFDRFAALARACGPVRVYPQKSRIVIQARIRFAGGRPQKSRFLAGFLLPRDTESPRIVKREEYGSRRYVGAFVPLEQPKDIDAEIRRLMRLAYAIGCQR